MEQLSNVFVIFLLFLQDPSFLVAGNHTKITLKLSHFFEIYRGFSDFMRFWWNILKFDAKAMYKVFVCFSRWKPLEVPCHTLSEIFELWHSVCIIRNVFKNDLLTDLTEKPY